MRFVAWVYASKITMKKKAGWASTTCAAAKPSGSYVVIYAATCRTGDCVVVWRCDHSAIKISLSTTGESFALFSLDLLSWNHIKTWLTIDIKRDREAWACRNVMLIIQQDSRYYHRNSHVFIMRQKKHLLKRLYGRLHYYSEFMFTDRLFITIFILQSNNSGPLFFV